MALSRASMKSSFPASSSPQKKPHQLPPLFFPSPGSDRYSCYLMLRPRGQLSSLKPLEIGGQFWRGSDDFHFYQKQFHCSGLPISPKSVSSKNFDNPSVIHTPFRINSPPRPKRAQLAMNAPPQRKSNTPSNNHKTARVLANHSEMDRSLRRSQTHVGERHGRRRGLCMSPL